MADFLYHYNVGTGLLVRGRIAEAIGHYKRSLALNPAQADAHNNLGIALVQQNRIAEAVWHYERALVLNPGDVNAYNNLGAALVQQGKLDDAIEHYARVLAVNPDHAEALNNMGVAHMRQGRTDDAVAHYKRVLAIDPDNIRAHNNLGVALALQGKLDDAAAHHRSVLTIDPDLAEAHNALGNIFKTQGRFDEAAARYGRAIAIRPDYAEAHFSRAEIRTFHQDDAELAALETLARRDDLPADKALIHFAIAKAHEDCGDFEQAFEHLRKGNDLKRRQIRYDEDGAAAFFRRIAEVFDKRLFDRCEREGDPSSTPIFVLGMPRSGSTLVEQILASHPRIHGAGELADLEAAAPAPFPERVLALDGSALRKIARGYLASLPALAGGHVRIIDKMPRNFVNIGLIRLILPNARIIHTMRNPMDTCFSCYSKLFTSGQEFSYDLAELGRYYRRYAELMDHWRAVLPQGALFDVSYEHVVDDLEGQARRLIEYCGLPWDDRCLSFDKNSRPVKTASAVQVRKPLFRNSLERWRKYETGLAPLLRELGDIIPGFETQPRIAPTPTRETAGLRESRIVCTA